MQQWPKVPLCGNAREGVFSGSRNDAFRGARLETVRLCIARRRSLVT
jgi:hypothetical protein